MVAALVIMIRQWLIDKCLFPEITAGELPAELPTNGSERVRLSSERVRKNCLAFPAGTVYKCL
jgi:hypothetical protein